jgi:hypothetical protein
MDRAAEAELDVPPGQLVQDVTSIGQRPGEPVQGVAGSAGSQRQSQARSVAVGAGQTVVDVDPVITNAQGVQAVALGGEILLFC